MAEDFSSDSNIIIFFIIYSKELRDEILHEDPSITTEVAEVCSWVKLGLTFLIVIGIQNILHITNNMAGLYFFLKNNLCSLAFLVPHMDVKIFVCLSVR